jgi:hypothetical protein
VLWMQARLPLPPLQKMLPSRSVNCVTQYRPSMRLGRTTGSSSSSSSPSHLVFTGFMTGLALDAVDPTLPLKVSPGMQRRGNDYIYPSLVTFLECVKFAEADGSRRMQILHNVRRFLSCFLYRGLNRWKIREYRRDLLKKRLCWTDTINLVSDLIFRVPMIKVL